MLKFFFFSILIMGSSRRRKKKHKSSSSSVRVGKVSQTRQFVEVKPLKLPSSGAEHAKTSENETSWNKETSCVNNYSRNGLVSNANRFYYVGGRNALADNVKNMDDDENANARKRKAADENVDRELRSGRVEESRRREEFLRHRETETIDAETEENLRTVDVKTRQRRGKDVSRY